MKCRSSINRSFIILLCSVEPIFFEQRDGDGEIIVKGKLLLRSGVDPAPNDLNRFVDPSLHVGVSGRRTLEAVQSFGSV
jgi:hypothetical protein